jgi:hypothetical protein
MAAALRRTRQLISREDMLKVAETPGVVTLGDNSNTWIEGKKHAGHVVGLTTEDSTWRVHTGQLLATVVGDRPNALFRIFGSAATEELWEKFEEAGISVDVSERSRVTGKEKKVDVRLLMLLAFECRHFLDWSPAERFAHRTYCVIGGDADYIDAVELALNSGLRVELWCWSRALANVYKLLKPRFPALFSLRFLDASHVFDRIGFRETLTPEQKLRLAAAGRERTLVFVPTRRTHFQLLSAKAKAFFDELTLHAHLVPTPASTAILLVLHFPTSHAAVQGLLKAARASAGEHNVKSWPEFVAGDAAAATAALGDEPPTGDAAIVTDARFFRPADEHAEAWRVAGSGEAELANRRTKRRLAARRCLAKKLQTVRCIHREFCTAPACTFAHSKEEVAFFQSHGGASPFKLLKTQLCNSGRCTRPCFWKECDSHHSTEPKFCRICLGAPCNTAICHADFERPLLRMNEERYRDLVARNYLQRK